MSWLPFYPPESSTELGNLDDSQDTAHSTPPNESASETRGNNGFPHPSSSSPTSSEASGDNTLQACLRTWSKLTGRLPPEEVTNSLNDAVKSITFEELTEQNFKDAFSTSCPLATLAKPLLENLKRYEPWDMLMQEIYVESIFFDMPWSRKIFLAPLITYLPLLRSRDVVERILEMNIPIPFVYPVPLEPSGVNHNERLQPCYTIPFSSLRNVIIPGKLFVLSCGTLNSEGNGKSTFLNMCFQTNFEVNAEDSFHSNSADVILNHLSMPLPYNVIDCHGTLPQPVLRLISHICRIGLIHVMPDDIMEDNIYEVLQLLETLSDVSVIIILLRDMGKGRHDTKRSPKLEQQLTQFKKAVDKWNKEHSTIAVYVREMPKIQTGEQFSDKFRKLLKRDFVPCFESLPERNKLVGFYEDLEAQLIAANTKEADNSTINLMTSSEQARILCKRLKLVLEEAENKIQNGDFVDTIFPLSQLKTQIDKEEHKLLTAGNENESVKEREKRESMVQLKIKNIQDKMKKIQGENQHQSLIDLFISTVVDTNDIANMDEFSKVVADFSKYTHTTNTGSTGGSAPSIVRSLREAPILLSMENFWREILLTTKDNISHQKVSELGQSLLRQGRPLEIINGDSLSMDADLLTDVLARAGTGSLVVCSVLGPQSSHKSTLLNYLFGCSFVVGAGRCTKGLYASLFNTEYKGAEKLLVLDTEGLLSIEKRDAVFDKQMTLLALALSHIVLINVKGEMGTEMKNILEVTMLGLKRLRVEFIKPEIFFILRDMTDLNKDMQYQAIHSVLNDIREVGERIDFKLKVNEESFILLPPALDFRDQENLFEETPSKDADHNTISKQRRPAYVERNVAFSRYIKTLKTRLLKNTVAEIRSKSSSDPFGNTNQWVTHAKTVWDAVQVFGDLLNFSTLKEYYDRNDLGRIAQEVVKSVLEEKFMSETMEKINNMLLILNSGQGTKHITAGALEERERAFNDIIDQRQQVYAEELKKTFADRVKDLRISEALKSEYEGTLLKALEKICYTARQEFQNKKGRGLVQVAIQDAIQEIRRWIDSLVSNGNATSAAETETALIHLFEKQWTSTSAQTHARLIDMQPSQETIDRNLRNDFYTVVKSMPSLTVLNNLIGTERNDDLVLDMLDILSGLDPKLPSFRSDWYAIMQEHYITRSGVLPKIFSRNKREVNVIKVCLGALESISKLFENIRQGKDKKLWNSAAVQGTIIELDNTIKKFDETILGPLGQHFIPMFYSICHASLFTLFRQIILEQHIQQTIKSMDEFVAHKENLKTAFIRLVTERYDDSKTSSSIAAFFVAAVSKKVTTVMDQEFLFSLKARVGMTVEQLVDKCEQLQSDDDIFLYITNSPGIMERTFNVHFDDGYGHIMEQIYMGSYRNKIDGEMKALYEELTNWKSWWSEPAVADFSNQISISAQAPDGSLPTTIYTSFVNHLRGVQPSRNCTNQLKQLFPPDSFKVILSSQRKSPCSKTDFSYLFAAIPQTQAVKDPSLFITELIGNMDLERQKSNFAQFKPDESGVKRLRNSLLEEAIGCRQKCPMCSAKCAESTVGHQTHRTDVHRMTAFNGWHHHGTKEFAHHICTSRSVYSSKWAPSSSNNFLPFNEFLKKYHPDWTIPVIENARIEIKNKIRWVKLRQRLCEHYSLEDNTPEEWLTLVKGYCPVCMNTFGTSECGDDVKTPCGHSICSPCLAQLRGRPEAERKCPQCRAILPRA